MKNLSLFDLYNIEVETKEVNVKKTKSEDSIVMNDSEKKVATPTKSKSQNEKILESLKKLSKVEVKAFGTQIMVFEKEQIANIDLKDVQSELVKMGFHEFTNEVVWQVVEVDKTTKVGILLAGCKFHAKG